MYDSPLGKLSFPDQDSTNRLQFFASLFEVNDVVYLDPHRHYCILKVQLYSAMKQELTESLNCQQKLQRELLEAQLACTAATRQAKVYREQLESVNTNLQDLAKEHERICDRSRQQQRTEAQLRLMLSQTKQRPRPQQSYPHHSPPQQTKSSTSQSCQTEWQEEEEEAEQVEAVEQPTPPVQIEAVEERLYELLQSEMAKFEGQFERRVQELQEQRLDISRWAVENQQLREENAKLQQQMVERNMEEEKLQAWRHGVAGFIDRIEHSIVQPHPEPLPEEEGAGEVGRLREEVVELRGRLVELRSRMRGVEQLMEPPAGEIEDVGAVGALVRLSQRVKAAVKTLVMEVEEL